MTEPLSAEREPASTHPTPSAFPTPRPRGRLLAQPVARDAFAVLGVLVLLGVLCGGLWWLLVSPAEYTKTRQGAVMDEVELGRQFSVSALYVVIALVAGLGAGLGLSWWRGRDPLVTSLLLVVGSLLAAAAMALVGYLLGPGDTGQALDAARLGARVPETLTVHRDEWTVYLAWPAAVLAGALVVLLGAPVDDDG
jgi:hypothetical protein